MFYINNRSKVKGIIHGEEATMNNAAHSYGNLKIMWLNQRIIIAPKISTVLDNHT